METSQTRTQTLRRLYQLEKNPELFRDLSPKELADLTRIVLLQVEAIAEMIKSGVHDGYTPQEGKDYVGRSEALQTLRELFEGALADFKKNADAKQLTIEEAVRKRLSELTNGKNGEDALITEEMLNDLAARASALITLPNFQTLITQEPTAIRDALELLQGDERLAITAIYNLEERLQQAERTANSVDGKINAVVARKLGQIRDVNVEGVTNGQVLSYRESDRTWVPASAAAGTFEVLTPSESPNGSRTVFTVTAQPQIVFANGTMYFEGFGFSYSSLQITLDIAPDGGTAVRYVV